jgi:SAM-dependent methyltransferase
MPPIYHRRRVLPPLTLSGQLRYDVLRRELRKRPVRSILEIGPGTGGFAARLATEYEYLGVELDESSARRAAEGLAATGRGRIINGSPADIDGFFDLVCAFEVLEHIEDDDAALSEWKSLVKPGGWIALSVPAGPGRWGAHDVRAGHFRRYRRDQILASLAAAGYSDAAVHSYGFPLLTALHPLWNMLSARVHVAPTLDERTRASGRYRQPPAWSTALLSLGAAPFALLQRPFLTRDLGTGYLAIARNP